MGKFSKILIANRGEIAVRIARSAKAMGYRTVAIYSEADAEALHVQIADQAVCVGPAAVSDSYLRIDRILEAAEKTGADAIHPGYGFLSENAFFARACTDGGLTFIGPSGEAILLMGNKRAAKERMLKSKVPCVPGYQGPDQSDSNLIRRIKKIGFPVMIKAAAGGGGRGMRLVHEDKDLEILLKSARSESLNAFGSDELILEKAIINPHHVEIQVFADTFGNTLYLGERDCSVQRRHQKVVEEAPSPIIDASLRQQMGEAAVAAAKAVNYVGAGTVEFLVDETKAFFFLEMNTRLQVEHPVTEMITGLDLVAMQLDVAAGKPLNLTQEQVQLRGHAIEVRLYAEDPNAGFLPQTGPILAWSPTVREGIRTDHGLRQGGAVSSHYDPMLAKVIAHGKDRDEARRRLRHAVADCVLLGVKNNKHFLTQILDHEVFAEGKASTGFIPEFFSADVLKKEPLSQKALALATVLFHEKDAQTSRETPFLRNWQNANPPVQQYKFKVWEEPLETTFSLTTPKPGKFNVKTETQRHELALLKVSEYHIRFVCDGLQENAAYAWDRKKLYLEVEGRQYGVENIRLAQGDAEGVGGKGQLIAVMNGRIVAVNVKPGDPVEVGKTLVVLEAMKMEHQIKSDVDGVVKEVLVRQGQQVDARQLLVQVEFLDTKA
ncbi:acetyl-CoA carboxylase biotin carboxylase subunit [Deltaproteobacteria bacterium TL4]